jgi:hypothetical protein
MLPRPELWWLFELFVEGRHFYHSPGLIHWTECNLLIKSRESRRCHVSAAFERSQLPFSTGIAIAEGV